MKNLNNRVAFVTGGASGIGLGIVSAFLEKGMYVVAADINDEHLNAAKGLFAGNDHVRFIKLDVTDREAMKKAAHNCQEWFGKVHVLCNNAGIGIMAGAKEASYADWDWSLDVNLNSVFNGIHCFLPDMIAHGEGGHIVNTASVASVLPANIVYATAKGAVMSLSEGLRAELANDNIGVTCLFPGPTSTNIHKVAALRPGQYADTSLHDFERQLADRQANPNWLDPMLVGDLIVDAIERNLLFVFTHAEHKQGVEQRFKAILAAFPHYKVSPDSAEKLGFRIANPMYDEILKENQPPAKHRKS